MISVFVLSWIGILSVFVLYPVGILFLSRLRKLPDPQPLSANLSVSLVVAARNAHHFISDKVNNSLSLDYPRSQLQIIMFSDGSTDDTEDIIKSHGNDRVELLSSSTHEGKANVLNRAILRCTGDIVVFSDADVLLNQDALSQLVKHYSDPAIGGVCGQRVIGKDNTNLRIAQESYITLDSTLKVLESRIGSITSNDGKLYSIRRELFQPIPSAVTDDLYVCLNIVRQGWRFVFEPQAKAYISIPSRNAVHELQRRRRIVSRSLRGIFLMREMLNPFRYGMFAGGLAINKIMRRLIPIFLILLFFSSFFLAFSSSVICVFFVLQLVFYLFALSFILSNKRFVNDPNVNKLISLASVAYYFCVGNIGTLLGLMDFIMNKKITKWDPVKSD
jgi:Glycosyltransferases, probably involved in cell wall biogenesis